MGAWQRRRSGNPCVVARRDPLIRYEGLPLWNQTVVPVAASSPCGVAAHQHTDRLPAARRIPRVLIQRELRGPLRSRTPMPAVGRGRVVSRSAQLHAAHCGHRGGCFAVARGPIAVWEWSGSTINSCDGGPSVVAPPWLQSRYHPRPGARRPDGTRTHVVMACNAWRNLQTPRAQRGDHRTLVGRQQCPQYAHLQFAPGAYLEPWAERRRQRCRSGG